MLLFQYPLLTSGTRSNNLLAVHYSLTPHSYPTYSILIVSLSGSCQPTLPEIILQRSITTLEHWPIPFPAQGCHRGLQTWEPPFSDSPCNFASLAAPSSCRLVAIRLGQSAAIFHVPILSSITKKMGAIMG